MELISMSSLLDTATRGRARPLRVLLRNQSELALQLLAQQVLLDLAGDRLRKAVHETHVARYLVVCDLSATELADVLFGRSRSITQPDASTDLLSVPVVREPDDGDVENGRVAIKKFLDFPGIDVLSTADDHVFDAPDNIAVALLVEDRQIPGVHPS